MMTQDNDTLYAEQQNMEQQNANETNDGKKKVMDAMRAKLLASAAAGMAIGAGATYAAEHLTGTAEEATAEEVKPEEATAEEVAAEENQDEVQPAAEPTADATMEARIAEMEAREHVRVQQEQLRQQHEMERQQHEQVREQNELGRQQKVIVDKPTPGPTPEPPAPKPDGDFFKDHDVKIVAMEECEIEDGVTVNVYTGTVDGHDAQFMDDGNGRILAVIIDENDNGEADANEVFDLRSQNMTDHQLASHYVSQPVHEVEVVAVEHDVDMEGETVDVAVLSVDQEPVVLVDTTQDGEVNLHIADANHDGEIEAEEIHDVSEAHMPMPTEDDITGNVTAGLDDVDDYTNDADIDVYDA